MTYCVEDKHVLITVSVIFIYSFLLPPVAKRQHVEVMSRNLQQVFILFRQNTLFGNIMSNNPR